MKRVLLVLALLGLFARPLPAQEERLPSWRDGAAKTAVLTFVTKVTKEGSPDFIPPAERVAVFDNDGTLWPEQPIAQLHFTREKLKALADFDPSLKTTQPYKAALEGDAEYFHDPQYGESALMDVMAKTHANIPQFEFDAEARQFFLKARHPTLNRPYTDLAYRPMVELLACLRANGFSTWVCTGGGQDFVSAVAFEMYGVPPEQVIGSTLKKQEVEKYGTRVTWRLPEVESANDKAEKVVNLKNRIGKHPAFCAGNVRSGGDVQMLEYSRGRGGPSFQLLINHDDAAREFAYGEKDNASLNAAKKHGWTVVSMKDDWGVVFAPPGGAKRDAGSDGR